jgi:spermidine synthase
MASKTSPPDYEPQRSTRLESQLAARRSYLPLEVIVFVVGAASLGAEIAATRLLAPYFGASTVVWANTIATVLVSLSVGYAVGGRVADRAPYLAGLCAITLVAAVLLAIVPFLSSPLLGASVKALDSIAAGAFVGSLVGVLSLVAIPIFLLGAIAPYAVRLRIDRLDRSGRTSGRLYAISTVGSLFGTFASALLLVPLVGTRRTFLTFALALALVACSGMRRRFWVVPAAILLLFAFGAQSIKKQSTSGRVAYETETPYQYARVVDDGNQRRLELNEGLATHSLISGSSYLTGGYWDDFLVIWKAVSATPPGQIAILGNAAGTTARAYGHYFPATDVDAVEIDGKLTDIGRRMFDLRGPRLHTYTADARPFLERTNKRYDAIFVDAYRQPYIPFYLTTREFFQLVADHLTPNGVVVVNVGHPEQSPDLEQVISTTMHTSFPQIARDPVSSTNSLLMGTRAQIHPAGLSAATGLTPELSGIAGPLAGRIVPPLSGGSVYTDDRAPIEWLIDQSILSYAEKSH